MKKICLFTLITYFSVAVLHAQSTSVNVETKADSVTEEVNQLLHLDQNQQSAVQLTWEEYYIDLQEVMQNDGRNKRTRRKSIQRLAQVRDLKMKGILDEDQYAEYEVFVESIKPSDKNWF